MINKIVEKVTNQIIERSKVTRREYMERMKAHYGKRVQRAQLACTNLAHAVAAEDANSKLRLKTIENPNIGIVTAYNDMLSAHQPYYRYPELIKDIALQNGATAQVAGGVPAMCDGVTQGQVGMEMSLLSREVIALSTAVSLSHNVFDGVICLGICDKIVPGLMIGALSYGYLPTIFIPSGPMPSGISNKDKTETRKLFAEGKVGAEALLESELKSYHAPGTCTFYGTANTNQMMMEIMGLHIPSAAFIHPNTELRTAITKRAVKQIINNTAQNSNFTPICEIVNEKSIVNALVGLLATGGSTNHTLHIPAIAKAAGIIVNWDDFAELSSAVPLLATVYPNGPADVNQFHDAGGMAYIIEQLLKGGYLHNDVKTVLGNGLEEYTKYAILDDSKELTWTAAFNKDNKILSSAEKPFSPEGGVKLLQGNLGRSVTKISAIAEEHRYVKAPAEVFHSQEDVLKAYKSGALNKDVVVVLKYQGPRANGMPELHQLTPALLSLQDHGYKVALVTDGRMSGATGKVPNAIHLTPETLNNENVAKIVSGDVIELDLNHGVLQLHVSNEELANRKISHPDLTANTIGFGRELFNNLRSNLSDSELGATLFH